MSFAKTYFDIIISNRSFYITELSYKPKADDSAIATLSKIETVIKNNFEYNEHLTDAYSKKSKIELWEILQKKSSEIQKGYVEKQSKLHWLVRKFFSKEKRVSELHTTIENYISPPRVIDLPNELIEKICKHLGVSEIGTFAQLNRHGKEYAASSMVKCAQEFGYEGIDKNQAVKYLKNIFNELQNLTIHELILTHSFSYKGKEFDSEKILEKYLNSAPKKIIDINSRNEEGYTALIVAAKAGNKKAVQLLLEHGADHSLRSRKFNNIPAHWAASNDCTDILKLFLHYGTDVNYLNSAKNTFLMTATRQGKKEVAELLLQKGANPNILNRCGQSILLVTIQSGKPEMIQLLLEYGADPTLRSEQTYTTPVHEAILRGYTAIIRLFLQYGTDVNLCDSWGNPLLKIAADAGKTDVVQLLLEEGANPNIGSGNYNRTPMHVAANGGYTDIVKLLLQYHADANPRDFWRGTPLQLAASASRIDVVKLLYANGGV